MRGRARRLKLWVACAALAATLLAACLDFGKAYEESCDGGLCGATDGGGPAGGGDAGAAADAGDAGGNPAADAGDAGGMDSGVADGGDAGVVDAGPPDAGFSCDASLCLIATHQTPRSMFDIAGTTNNSIWVVGRSGMARFFDGVQWVSRQPAGLFANTDLYRVKARAPGEFIAVTSNTYDLYRTTGGAWTKIVTPGGDSVGVDPTGPLWTSASYSTLYRQEPDSGWAEQFAGTLSFSSMSDIAVRGEEVWAVSSSDYSSYRAPDGGWSELLWSPNPGPTAVVTVAPGEAWWVGDYGAIGRFRDGGWQSIPAFGASDHFDALCAVDPDDVWAVGDLGLVAHFDGTTWRRVDPFTDLDLEGVACVEGKSEIWVASTTYAFGNDDGGVVYRLLRGR